MPLMVITGFGSLAHIEVGEKVAGTLNRTTRVLTYKGEAAVLLSRVMPFDASDAKRVNAVHNEEGLQAVIFSSRESLAEAVAAVEAMSPEQILQGVRECGLTEFKEAQGMRRLRALVREHSDT